MIHDLCQLQAFTLHTNARIKRRLGKLDFILQFNIKLAFVKREENVVTDTLSHVTTSSLPAALDPKSIALSQAED